MGFLKLRGVDISDADAVLANVLNPKTFYSVAAPRKTGTMPTVALASGSNAYPAGYHAGAANLVHVEPTLQAAFILAGINIFGIVGTSGIYDRWYPVTIALPPPTVAVVAPDHTDNEPAPLTSQHVETYGDLPASGVKQLTPTLGLTDAESVMAAADQEESDPADFTSQVGMQMLIDGAVADDGGVETDETAQARDATANDMTLLPAAPAVGDAYMLGSTYKADVFWLNIGTAGAGNWTLQMFYWDGAAWVASVDEVETSAQFQASGLKSWRHTPQGDWATKVIQGMDLYWVRIEVVNFVNIVTQPLGTQSWWEKFY
jgi:hypothetical protein